MGGRNGPLLVALSFWYSQWVLPSSSEKSLLKYSKAGLALQDSLWECCAWFFPIYLFFHLAYLAMCYLPLICSLLLMRPSKTFDRKLTFLNTVWAPVSLILSRYFSLLKKKRETMSLCEMDFTWFYMNLWNMNSNN